MQRFGIAATIFLVALGAATAAAAQAVVVSDGADIGFARGSTIEEGATLKVPAGRTLELIDASGKGQTIRGPFEGKLSTGTASKAPDPSILRALHFILIDQRQKETGTVRAAGEKPQPPDARLVDLSDSATFCVAPGQLPQLWRPAPRPHATLTLMRLSNGTRGDVEWPANQPTVAWPASVPLADGETYQALLPSALVRPRLVIKLVPIDAPSVAEAQKLAEAGCREQALTMLEAIAAPGSDGH
ncbi:MAG TPA: hypothetical protein VLV50_12770 [Stellaceae bacterium]|nr:hypothetical protein [Stellaceae bacterium]